MQLKNRPVSLASFPGAQGCRSEHWGEDLDGGILLSGRPAMQCDLWIGTPTIKSRMKMDEEYLSNHKWEYCMILHDIASKTMRALVPVQMGGCCRGNHWNHNLLTIDIN